VEAQCRQRRLTNVITARTTAEALPFADAHFDAVASRFSAHHWASLAQGLAQARRVCQPGALALFADVIAPAQPQCDTHLQAVELLRDASTCATIRWPNGPPRSPGRFCDHRNPARPPADGLCQLDRADGNPAALAAAIRTLQQDAPA
jgi:SAM-dependent methyltransferase